MCYKVEKHQHLTVKLNEKLKDFPPFIADFFDRYKSATTKNCNFGYIRDLLQWLIEKGYIDKESISEITPEDMNAIKSNQVIKYLNELKDGVYGRRRRNSLESINTKKKIFSSFWGYLFKNRYVDDNIVEDIPKHLYKSENTINEVKVPTDDQIEQFRINLASGNHNEYDIVRNSTIVELMLGSGIRSEELINLDMQDLFLDGEKPYIMVLGKGKIEVYDKVFISQAAKDSLIEYLRFRDLYVRENDIHNDALFLSNYNERMSKGAIQNFFNRYSGGTINPHMLRHWVGTKIYQQTKNIGIVQSQLRHASVETAMKYYVNISDNDVTEAVANL